MSAHEDEDGIDGPFERAIAASMREDDAQAAKRRADYRAAQGIPRDERPTLAPCVCGHRFESHNFGRCAYCGHNSGHQYQAAAVDECRRCKTPLKPSDQVCAKCWANSQAEGREG